MFKKGVAEFWLIGGRHIVLVLTGCGVLQRRLGHSTLKGGAIKGSMEARIYSVVLLLGKGDLALSLSRTSEGRA